MGVIEEVRGVKTKEIVIPAIVTIISIIVVAGVVIYLKGTQSLVTKDPSEMALSLNELSSDYWLDNELYIYGPSEAAEQLSPSSEAIWSNWGFEISIHRYFHRKDWLGNETSIGVMCWVDRYSSIDGAKKSYDYRYNLVSEGGDLYLMSETIGEESYAISSTLPLDTIHTYGVFFRKKNVFVGIICEGSITEAKEYARIVESKIS